MTYYRDLDLCEYNDGPYSASNWECQLLVIGWLERQHDFPVGKVSEELLIKLKDLRAEFKRAFPLYAFRGLHECSICEDADKKEKVFEIPGFLTGGETGFIVKKTAILDGSDINLFVPGDEVMFIAPGRIDHYIEAHSYQPPREFLMAVEKCPSPLTAEYAEITREVNQGKIAPLYEDA